jgi:TPR repeat protein
MRPRISQQHNTQNMQFFSKKNSNNQAELSWKLQDSLRITPNNAKKAYALALAGAASGCSRSKGSLARCYFYGNGVQADAAVARMLAEESAAAHCAFGHFVLGRCMQDGAGGENDASALLQYRLAARQGVAIALHYVGMMLYFCLGVAHAQEHDDHAELLWLRAVQQGYSASCLVLAYKYEVEQCSHPTAVRVFEAAAEMGDANAQLHLGRMYEEGRGVFANTKKALKLYNSARMQGHDGAVAALVAALTCGKCCGKYDRLTRAPLLLPCGCTFCEHCTGMRHAGRVVGVLGVALRCPGCGWRGLNAEEVRENKGVRAALGRGYDKLLQQQQPKGLKRKQLRRAAAAAASRPGIQL